MKLYFTLFTLLFSTAVSAQIGGNNVYEFLNTSPSARITGLGGNLIAVLDDDLNLAYANPSALNKDMHQAISFNYNFHLAGISEGYAAYAHHLDKLDMTFHAAAKFLSYGDFDATDVFGNINGTFTGSDNAFIIGASKRIYDKLSAGINMKIISSKLETYTSAGIVGDAALMYHDTSSNFNISLVAKSFGGQLSAYNDLKEDIPFEMQLGISKQLKHLPFRWSIVYTNLNRWNVLYDDPDNEENSLIIGDLATEDSPSKVFFDNLGRHFIVNGEFLFGRRKMFNVRIGYNHLLKKELKVQNLRSIAGFSFGVGFRLKMFQISYGHGAYHLAGGTNHLSISTNIQRFTKKI